MSLAFARSGKHRGKGDAPHKVKETGTHICVGVTARQYVLNPNVAALGLFRRTGRADQHCSRILVSSSLGVCYRCKMYDAVKGTY